MFKKAWPILFFISFCAQAQKTSGIPPIADKGNIHALVPMLNERISACEGNILKVEKLDFIQIYEKLSDKMIKRNLSHDKKVKPESAPLCADSPDQIDSFFYCMLNSSMAVAIDEMINSKRFVPYFEKECKTHKNIKIEDVRSFYRDLLKEYKVVDRDSNEG